MAITLDTNWGIHENSVASGTNVTASHGAGVNAKLMIVCTMADQTISNIADNQGNAYTIVQLGNVAGTRFAALAYAYNPVVTVGTVHTATYSSAAKSCIGAATFNGTATSAAFDKMSALPSQTGASTTPLSFTAPNTTFPNEVLFGFGGNGFTATTWSANGSFTQIDALSTGNSPGLQMEYRVVSATGAYATGQSLSASASWLSAILTFADTPVPPSADIGGDYALHSLVNRGPGLAGPYTPNAFSLSPFNQFGPPPPPPTGGTQPPMVYRRWRHKFIHPSK